MADVTITYTQLVPGTATVDLVGSGTAVNASQTFEIKLIPAQPFPPVHGGETSILLFIEELNNGAAVVTIDAGDYPPSLQAPMGADTISLAQDDEVVYALVAGQHLSADGYIRGSVSGNNVRIRALRLPSGY